MKNSVESRKRFNQRRAWWTMRLNRLPDTPGIVREAAKIAGGVSSRGDMARGVTAPSRVGLPLSGSGAQQPVTSTNSRRYVIARNVLRVIIAVELLLLVAGIVRWLGGGL